MVGDRWQVSRSGWQACEAGTQPGPARPRSAHAHLALQEVAVDRVQEVVRGVAVGGHAQPRLLEEIGGSVGRAEVHHVAVAQQAQLVKQRKHLAAGLVDDAAWQVSERGGSSRGAARARGVGAMGC